MQLTAVSPDSFVLNGIPDWVYEEEILYSNSAIWFSDDGEFLCFASFNDSLVPDQGFEWYFSRERHHLYPEPIFIRYPKVGYIFLLYLFYFIVIVFNKLIYNVQVQIVTFKESILKIVCIDFMWIL